MSSALIRGRTLNRQDAIQAHKDIQARIAELKKKRDNHTLTPKERKELLRTAGWAAHQDQH
jgi:hypothetical protein